MAEHQTYEEYRKSLEQQIETARNRNIESVRRERTSHESMATRDIKKEIDSRLTQLFGDSSAEGKSPGYSRFLVAPPRNTKVGWKVDYALPAFELARSLGKNPVELAQIIAGSLAESSLLSRAEASGPYVNMAVQDAVLLGALDQPVNDAAYGQVNDHQHESIVIDYSSPNVAKPFGVNHLRTTIIGEALSRLYEAVGYSVVRDNHLGDWGTQFGNLLAAHDVYAPDTDFVDMDMDELNKLYVRFSQEKKESEELKRMGQEYFARLEKGDAGLMDNWAHALKLSMEEFSSMYERLNVRFDTFIGEAYYVDKSYKLIAGLPKDRLEGLVEFSKDSPAVVINGQHPVVVITGDGYGVYAARDLETIDFRVRCFEPDDIVYVVGEEQSSYFKTIFEVADRAGLTLKPDGNRATLEFVGFGLLLDKDGKKLSTRKGTSGKLEDVIDAVEERAAEETRKRNPDLADDEVEAIARKVSVGAVIWNDLRTDRISSVRFDIDRMLELGGDSVVDVLYTFSRSTSILNRLGVAEDSGFAADMPGGFSTEHEHRIALKLSEYSDVIRRAVNDRAPHILAAYISELAQLHGRFYEESRVIGIEDQELANMRVNLHRAYRNVIRSGLGMLNIRVTDRL